MTDERRAPSCDDVSEGLAELALGILTGRERSVVLEHLAGCPRCSAELEQLSVVADSFVHLAAEIEPPVGFEVRLFERLGVDPPTVAPDHKVVRSKAWAGRGGPMIFAVAAALLLLAVAFGAGWFSGPGSSRGHHLATGPTGQLTSAVLRAGSQNRGRVMLYDGRPPWMFMTVTDSGSAAKVTCEISTVSGATLDVGTFWLSADGYGAWGASLPVPADQVRYAEVVGPGGTILATADFTG